MDSKCFLGAFLTIAPYFVSATFQALGEKGPLIVPVGEDAILPCWLSRVDQLIDVRWFRIRAKDVALINLFRDGKEQQKCDIRRYVGRTELITTDINRGKVALKIRSVSVADEGAYRCYLETLGYFDHADFELKVTALGSDPRIDIEELLDGRIKAMCRSEGWYPEPMLLTKDTDGKMVEESSSKKIQSKNGLYDIEYSHLIAEKSSSRFSCIIRTAFPNQERESSLYMTDAVFRNLDSFASLVSFVVPVLLSVTVIFGIYVAYLVFSWFWRRCSKRCRGYAKGCQLRVCGSKEKGSAARQAPGEDALAMAPLLNNKEQSQEDLDRMIKEKETSHCKPRRVLWVLKRQD